jgi:Squalene-hopene cyclase C-terminal domain/Prenyltransferase and squalene oxidase repeat
MSWQAGSMIVLAVAIGGGFAWFERSRPPARIVAAVAALAALGVAGRVVLAPIPNVVATTDVALLAGYALGGGPGFAVGALSGLVSNLWLGQGPWTPWQMAGWGLVGIAGAVLARLSGRRLGRWQLAFWAAAAGLAYGALLDLSVMVSYGGEQSIDRYLALSARGIPFNVAHAAGNFTLMLAAGPAMVRMLDRYRDRFDFAWRDGPLGRATLGLLVALFVGLPLLTPPGADAKAGGGAAKEWLLSTQNKNGGYGSSADADSSVGMTGWAMLGMESAGLNPRDNRRSGNTPVDYLRRNAVSISSTGDLERTIIALVGAGNDPRAFAGRDLVGELRDRQNPDGSYQQQVNLTAFAILAMKAGGVETSKLQKPAKWLRQAQNNNGGWGSVAGAASEPDSTGAVLQALAAAPGSSDQIDAGVKWLRDKQHGTGGWSLTAGASSNTQSTAWAVQGLVAAGKNPANFKKKSDNPYDYLKRRQREDGHYEYSSASDQTPVWVTAQGLSAAYSSKFPLSAVPRLPKPPAKDPTTTTDVGPTYTPFPSGTDSSSYDYGSSDLGNLFNDTSGSGSGSYDGGGGGGGAEGGQSIPGVTDGVAASGAGRERIPANSAGLDTAATTAAAADEPTDNFEAPATPVLLGGLGGLSALLGAGFIWYRRRLP